MHNLAGHEETRTRPQRTMNEVVDGYEARVAWWEATRAAAAARERRWSWARLGLFAAGLVAVFALDGQVRWLALLVIAAGYTLAARQHSRERSVTAQAGARVSVAREGISRTRRRWNDLPATVAEPFPSTHPFAADLGVLGRASLMQLMGPVGAATGAATLREWLGAPGSIEEIRLRQAAAAELADKVELREELASRARLAGGLPRAAVSSFVDWAESDLWLETRPLLRLAGWVVPVATLVSIVLAANGVVPLGIPLVSIVVAVVIHGFAASQLGNRIRSAAPGESRFATLAEPFRVVHDADVEAEAWRGVRVRLETNGRSAHQELAALRRGLDAAAVRYSPMLHMALNALLLWDVQTLRALESWQKRSGSHVRDWFTALGEAEALAALGTLAHDNPGWSFPEIAPESPSVEARSLAHPLLPPGDAVANDVTVGPRGTVLVVSGSNMAGKSTLLRAIGANVVLAQAGAPVAAAGLVLPPLQLATCMRVTDSLEDGVSLFMAELRRLRLVVDAARAAGTGPAGGGTGPSLLYLLDEILQGTNTAERQVASRRVLSHLLEAGAIGAVSTHDLELASTDELQRAARQVHFRETVESDGAEGLMSFDYVLREGPATSANALRLVELVGLG